MQSTERIRNQIAVCRQAGSECRFQDAIQAADTAIAMIIASSTSSQDNRLLTLLRQHAVALGYKGMALLTLKQFDASALALEESYRLFQDHISKNKLNNNDKASSVPLLHKVTSCLVQVCRILGRDPPLPPLVKFPRTAHLFRPRNSQAVTDDDVVLSRDDSMFKILATAQHHGNDNNNTNNDDSTGMRISIEEKIDGANLGISLSLNGNILIQNRSHYISHGEHAQFSRLATWVEMHLNEIKRILGEEPSSSLSASSSATTNTTQRRILYGEWVVAKHSIPYGRLPAYFIAFDISENDRFISRRRFHEIMQGSGIPATPTLADYPCMTGQNQKEIENILLGMLKTPSQFRTDGGPLEGIVVRVDAGDWMKHRCKLVDPEFTAGITGHWAKHKIEKQRVDADFALDYLDRCCVHGSAAIEEGLLPTEVLKPRQRAVVVYKENEDSCGGQGFSASCSILPKEPSSTRREGMIVLPRNLCWLWPDEVLVASTPKSREQIQAMHDALQVGLVITLTKEEPLESEWFSSMDGCDNYFSPIPNGMYPTLEQMDDIGDAIVRTVSSGKAVLEHCGGGKGRAGTIATCLLLRFGRDGIRARIEAENNSSTIGRYLTPREPYMSSEEAIKEVRQRRPGSLETVVQENFVREYAQCLWRNTDSNFDDPFSVCSSEEDELKTNDRANACTNRSKAAKRRCPRYIILAGLPGSGKSSLAKQITLNEDGQDCNSEWVHASTDEMGKKTCCNVVGRLAAQVGQCRAGGIIVDACNINASKRREWFDIMHRPSRESTALVFFDIPAEVCAARVRCRVDHPTIPFGRGGRVVESFVKQMELPAEKERKLFGQIIVLRSKDELSSLLASWGITVRK